MNRILTLTPPVSLDPSQRLTAPTIQVNVRKPRPASAPAAITRETPSPAAPQEPLRPAQRLPYAATEREPAGDHGEVLIARAITFRHSTFGGIKAFIREHQGRTGVTLTNAAAVDLLLREHLPNRLSMKARLEMRTLSMQTGMQRLQGVQDRGEA